jgi:NADP-dependent 3-hydroxy acid dehydrogenase YdfG
MRKKAIVTGATSGIGLACANILAKNGFDLILNGRRIERLEKISKDLTQKYNINTLLMAVDVRDYQSFFDFFANIDEKWKNIDVLVNNAGLAAGLTDIADGDIDHWNRMIDTNIKGLLHATKVISNLMIPKKSGHIINIGSIAGKEVYPGGNVYCGTKHMVDALNRSMRRELAEHEIRVSGIHPGAVETEFSIVRFDGDENRAAKVYDGFENLIADDIAEAVWFCVNRPEHVNINDLVIMPKAQPAAGHVIRK